jgi:hypothetical protein
MSHESQALLEAFEHLPAEEKSVLADEILRRVLPFDSGPLMDEEIGTAGAVLFKSLDEEDANPAAARAGRQCGLRRSGPRAHHRCATHH